MKYNNCVIYVFKSEYIIYWLLFSRQVYVRKFGGFAMSQNDWRSQYDKLRSDLQKEGAKFKDNKEFSHLSYDSPESTIKNRRNEIWVELDE